MTPLLKGSTLKKKKKSDIAEVSLYSHQDGLANTSDSLTGC